MPTALIVEDEPEANMLLSMLVQLRGYGTESAFTGGEALAKIDENPPDIVFLDLMLPDINGYEICKSIKSEKSTTLIPVVMVTARVSLENRILSYALGADHYVPKPYTPDQIFDAMAEADSWRRDLHQLSTSREIPFEASEDGETLRQLAQLRSLMLALTPIDVATASAIHAYLLEMWQDAEVWGKAHCIDKLATLTYRASADRIVISLRDHSGWLKTDPRHPESRWQCLDTHHLFDEITSNLDHGSLTFVLKFQEHNSA